MWKVVFRARFGGTHLEYQRSTAGRVQDLCLKIISKEVSKELQGFKNVLNSFVNIIIHDQKF